MLLFERIKEDMTSAMRGKKERELLVLRMLVSAIKNKEIEKRSSAKAAILSDEEVIRVIRAEVKKRKDACEQFTKGGREDLAEKESLEQAVLEEYLPQEMSDDDLEKIIVAAIVSLGAPGEKNFGRVMGEVMKRVKGQASGERVSAHVKNKLPH